MGALPFERFSTLPAPVFFLFAKRQENKAQKLIIHRLMIGRNADDDVGLFYI
jgi:hypothetical protein